MEYFVYCRDRPGSAGQRAELAEAHWSFMDRYAEAMIARGPTLEADGITATGSVHIVDLPSTTGGSAGGPTMSTPLAADCARKPADLGMVARLGCSRAGGHVGGEDAG